MKYLSRQSVVTLIQRAQGAKNQREFAQEIGVSPAYLSDVYLGRRDPGKSILQHFGLIAEVRYKAVR